jgi:Spy/CpxP family protein refolding chaperone
MRITSRLIASTILVLALAVGASAQQPPRPGGGGFGGFGGFGGGGFGGGGQSLKTTLLTNKALQDELKISDDLKEKFTKFQEAQVAEMQKLATLGQDDDDQIARLKAQIKVIEDRKALLKDLSSEQTKRLEQIDRQRMGLGAFNNEKVVKELKLSDDQKDKVKTINDEMNKDMRELFTAGFGADTQKKIASLREEAMDKAVELLTADQRKQWKEMTGEKFDLAKLQAPRPMRRDN